MFFLLRASRSLVHPSSVRRYASSQGVTPGIPPAHQASAVPPDSFLSIRLPDLSQSDPELPVQIPEVPDLWDSASKSKSTATTVEPVLPKLLLIGGEGTYQVEPSSNLLDGTGETDGSVDATSRGSMVKFDQSVLWDDITEDLGIPRLRDFKKTVFKYFP